MPGKDTTITIKTVNGPREVRARQFGPYFAVLKKYQTNDGVTLTHIPTGLQLGPSNWRLLKRWNFPMLCKAADWLASQPDVENWNFGPEIAKDGKSQEMCQAAEAWAKCQAEVFGND